MRLRRIAHHGLNDFARGWPIMATSRYHKRIQVSNRMRPSHLRRTAHDAFPLPFLLEEAFSTGGLRGRTSLCPHCRHPVTVPPVDGQINELGHREAGDSAPDDLNRDASMSDGIKTQRRTRSEDEGTNVRRFLTRRGLLMMKEFKKITNIKVEYRLNMALLTLKVWVQLFRLQELPTMTYISVSASRSTIMPNTITPFR